MQHVKLADLPPFSESFVSIDGSDRVAYDDRNIGRLLAMTARQVAGCIISKMSVEEMLALRSEFVDKRANTLTTAKNQEQERK